MGNQLFANYDVEKEVCCYGGLNGIWKIYSAVKQDSTKRKVSIWTFDKKSITDKAAKSAKEEIGAFLKKESTSLLKIRHPNIVNIVEPLIEDKQQMAFITERVDDSLYSLMKKNDFNSICQSELELKLQVESLLKVLQFLHNDVKMAHLGLSPENIFIVNGQWKLAGFTFATTLQSNQQLSDVANADYSKRPFEAFCQFFPNLSFSSPEVAEMTPKCSAASDIFSLALLLMLMFQIKYAQSTNVVPALNSKQIGDYSHQLANLQNHFKSQNYIQRDMNEEFKKLLSRMLAKNVSTRPTIEQIKQSSWMSDPFVKAIYMLENIVELEQSKQVTFLAGMSNILFKYEQPVIKKRILPQLIDLTKFEYMIPPILGVVVECLKQPDLFSIAEFQKSLAPFVIGLTKRKSIPGKALHTLIVNCDTFFKFFDKNEFSNVYMVPVLKCFDIPQLQGFVLAQCDFLMSKLDYMFTKTKLLPKVLILCTSPTPSIMKKSIITLKKCIPNLDKNILNDQVLGTLEKLRKMSISDKSITMLILDIYQLISKSLDILVIAQKILPNLIPYLIDQSLGKNEFTSYLNAVNVMIKQIENERMKQLKDIGGVVEEVHVEEDTTQQENKPAVLPDIPAQKGKEFEFLSIFDEPKKENTLSPPANNNKLAENVPSNSTSTNSTTINNSNSNFTNQPAMPAKPSVLQMDFNFDMFDNIGAPSIPQLPPAQPSNEVPQNNAFNNGSSTLDFNFDINSNASTNFNNNSINNAFNNLAVSNNSQTLFNPNAVSILQHQKKDSSLKVEYKDPFAAQKAPKKVEDTSNDFFTQHKVNNQPTSSAFNKPNNQQNVPFDFSLPVNNNQSKTFSNQKSNSLQPASNLPVQTSLFDNPSSNNNDLDLFSNFKQPQQQQPQYNLPAPAKTSWGAQDDPFSNLGGKTSNSFATISGQNINQGSTLFDNASSASASANLFDLQTGAQPNSSQLQGSSLFNNLKKNNSTTQKTNTIDDLFGTSTAITTFNNNNNNNKNGNGTFDLL